MINSLLQSSSRISEEAAGQYFQPIVGEILPNRPDVNVPIGNTASSLTNKDGTKFTRGWLSGAGGADIEQALGSTAFDVRPAPYNSRFSANFRAVVPGYGAPVAGLANWDVNQGYNRTFGPLEQARGEYVPTTWSNKLAGLDPISGNVGPRLATANDPITRAPTAQYYAYGQVREGGDGFPSYPFGGRKEKKGPKAAIAAARAVEGEMVGAKAGYAV